MPWTYLFQTALAGAESSGVAVVVIGKLSRVLMEWTKWPVLVGRKVWRLAGNLWLTAAGL